MQHDTGLTVYVSSTFSDLAPERQVVVEAASEAGFRVREPYVARPPQALDEVIAEEVTGADVFVLLVAFRHGYRLPTGASATETEYDTARKAGMPVVVFMLSETAPWPARFFASGAELEAVKRFRAKLSEQHVVVHFASASELKEQARATFMQLAVGAPGPSKATSVEGKLDGLAQDPVAEALLELRSQMAFLTTRVLDLLQSRAGGVPATFVPSAFLGAAAPQIDRDKVFVVMPYSMPWSKGVEVLITEACKSAGFQPDIAKYSEGRMIVQDIWKSITGCAAVIADISGANPNVSYEVGLADALGREVILMNQSVDVPVDFRGSRLLTYDNTIEGSQLLREELQNRLVALRQRAA